MRKIILFLLSLSTCFTACHKDDDPSPSEQSTTRTVMVYMAAENNLTNSNNYKYLQADLQEIIKGSNQLTDDQRLLVFVDSLNSNNKYTGMPCILEVHGGEVNKLYEFDHEFYSSDPAYFKQILQWMVANAPAQSYGLVLWGHASGWAFDTNGFAPVAASRPRKAYGLDYGSDDRDGSGEKWMNIPQMAEALADVPKLEFIFADCCNMMCAEVGYELRNATNYLIGSPAEIPGEGAPYDKIVPVLYKQGSDLYRSIIDTYYDEYKSSYNYISYLKGYSVPLSVIDTKHIEALAYKTHDILEQLTDAYPTYPAAPNVDQDSIAFYMYSDAPIMYDMRAFVKTYAPADVFEQWDLVYQQAVPYYRMSMKWMTISISMEYAFNRFCHDETQNGCVSMFIPRNLSSYYNSTPKYNTTYKLLGWNQVIDWSRFGWN